MEKEARDVTAIAWLISVLNESLDLKFKSEETITKAKNIEDLRAISFVHWCTTHYKRCGNTAVWESSDGLKLTTHQLLDVYKTSLGL